MSQSHAPQLITSLNTMREAVRAARMQGKRLGLVPTMGALHAGHLSLAKIAKAECDWTAVTVFVNPTQFGPHEDFDRYPRDLQKDAALLASAGVDIVFAPETSAMYPPGSSTMVEPPSVAEPLEGRCRPGHFRGVATIVLKLFQAIPADVAYFGQKDYQQSLVVRRMVEDLLVPIEIRVCPIVREPDGLAMSSRNAYLSASERQQAVAVARCVALGETLIQAGERDPAKVMSQMRGVLAEAGIDRVDYVAVADPRTLAEPVIISGQVVVLAAAWVGKTRLIDNRLAEVK